MQGDIPVMGLLETEIAGIKLKNPTVLASGVLGTTGHSLIRIANEGAGAVTTKSLGLKSKGGHKNPTIVELGGGSMLNAMGLPNPGVEDYIDELVEAKKCGVPIIASVFGETADDFADAAKRIEAAKPDMVELNISCPNVGTKGTLFGKDPDAATEVTKKVKAAVNIPVIVKLTPNADKIIEVAKAVEKAGADAITAINTVGPGMVIDIETATPVLSNKIGGLSGAAIRTLAIKHVFDISENVKIPIIGLGGISNGQDAIEMIMAGASAVGIGTAVYYQGIDVFKQISKEIEEFMLRKSFKSIEELVGVSHGGN